MKSIRRVIGALFLGNLATLYCAETHAQPSPPYPDRSITIVVGYPAGGGMDAVARIIGQRVSQQLGQSVLIENKPGAAGAIAAETVVRAAPDGHTLLLAETGLIMAQALAPRPAIDPASAFSPVSMVAELPLIVAVNPSFPAKDLDEFLSELRAHPDKYSYGSAGNGTAHHFAFELFKRESGTKVLHVPYRGGVAMMGDLVAGRIQIGVLSAQIAKPMIEQGKVRAIASLTNQRLSAFPAVPAVGARLKDFDATPRLFLLAPRKTPPKITAQLNTALQTVLTDPALAQALLGQGAVVSYGDSPSVSRYIAAEAPKWADVARTMSIRAD